MVSLKRAGLRKVLLFGGLGVLAFVHLCWIAQSLSDPYEKDLRSGYLLAKAMMNGVNPYLPIPELAKLWLPGHTVKLLLHATPHPFAVGWLCLPLAALGYPQAALAWLLFEGVCLLLAIVLWLRLMRQAVNWWRVGLIFFLLFAWYPLALEVWYGQFSLFLLPLFLAAWLALRKGKEALGGVLLGGLVVLKMMGGPLLLWLAWQRRWRAVGAAAACWTSAHLLAIGVHGGALVRDYYLQVGPQVSALYRGFHANLSIWVLGQRLFGEVKNYFLIVPLWDSPFLAKALTLLLPLGALALLLIAAQRAKHFDTGFALLMGGGIFLTPVTWSHYFVMALPALSLLWQGLAARHWPRWRTSGVVLLLGLLSVPHSLYLALIRFFVQGTDATGLLVVPALPALLTLVPLVALCLLLWQMLCLEQPPATVQPVAQTELEGETRMAASRLVAGELEGMAAGMMTDAAAVE